MTAINSDGGLWIRFLVYFDSFVLVEKNCLQFVRLATACNVNDTATCEATDVVSKPLSLLLRFTCRTEGYKL